MTTKWDADKISALLSSAFAPELTKPFNSTSAPTATIDVLLTFDAHGVSSHLNHISLFHGARQFIASLRANRPGWACPVDLYTLTSISVFRKYLGFGDSLVSIAAMALSKRGAAKDKEQRLLFLSDIGEVRTAQGAMTGAHISQMRWFRYGWIWASRYMYLNDLKLEKV
jgi:N-acetylglucosaminylphosphatidylinositol deacetylase